MRLRNGSVAWRAFQGEGTLVHLERDEIHSVNAAATLIIEKLKAGATLEELVAALCEKFEVDEETARRDAQAFVGQLRESDVLEEGAPPEKASADANANVNAAELAVRQQRG
jgi:hypothetical protein